MRMKHKERTGVVFFLPAYCYFLVSNTFTLFPRTPLCFTISVDIEKQRSHKELLRQPTMLSWKSLCNHLDHTVVSVVIQVIPCTFFPVFINNRLDAPSPHSPFFSSGPGHQFSPFFLAVLEVPLVQSFPGVPEIRHGHHVHPARVSLGYQTCLEFRADRHADQLSKRA